MATQEELPSDLSLHGKFAQLMAQQAPVTITVAATQDGNWPFRLGGGAPFCPCIYITAVQQDPDADRGDMMLEAGDEVIMVNDQILIGKSLAEVHDILHTQPEATRLTVRKLPDETPSGVEFFLRRTTEAFNAKMEQFGATRKTYEALEGHVSLYLRRLEALAHVQQEYGQLLENASTTETNRALHSRMTGVAKSHKSYYFSVAEILPKAKFVREQLHTYLTIAIPDAKQTQDRYMQARNQYLALCIRVAEMAAEQARDREQDQVDNDVKTGNYYFRFTLREAGRLAARHAQLRQDLTEKLQMLEAKSGIWKTFEFSFFALSAPLSDAHSLNNSPNLAQHRIASSSSH
ncbi:uncharacterized protein MONBRDRAFT_26798 [Monosiga brevicollis MX1]|uniref:PRKCA-binding protein n=1 Tax=Monosiga brevicollis TaxID=81824 RepID=A9V3E4_MONBE|nr:uncharacterized protein MONBRDRAFT_26798 [Monosiga brevicollis MX1]EDQ88174.1 predicted protein [Monosiga brevicollis MX1]|eukprot:XP_001747250.1 hypothetical protein [Monosiga brevicollis MX1]